MNRVLTPSQVETLTAIQDCLVPREGDLPGAGEAGGAPRVDALLVERPDWRPDLLVALQAIDVAAQRLLGERASVADEPVAGFLALSADERDAALREVEASHPRQFQRLLRLTYTAYYTDSAVQRARGFAVQPPLPGGHPLTPFDESRLDPIKNRGKLWRDA